MYNQAEQEINNVVIFQYNGEKWTLWDRFQIDHPMTLKEFIEHFERNLKLKISMLSQGVSLLYSFSVQKAAREERMQMLMPDMVRKVSRKPVEPYVKSLVFEICCDDENVEDIEVPFVVYHFVVLVCDYVCLDIIDISNKQFKGRRTGCLYLTSQRIIFLNSDNKDALKSISIPFVTVDPVQPFFSANYLKGKVKAQPYGNFEAKDNAPDQMFDSPPPYGAPPPYGFFDAPAPAYNPPQGSYYGWSAPVASVASGPGILT
ncbi:hypothetical protein QYM36_007544 [Artemia franciscana]|uniref:Ubiquitin-activating enzyme E1 C-terminal domain-containing protein n=1 Tax=Artemia franciscana TaxID=6661 RepID=A0AA88IDQ9_ARTSF|nr:hypothetical protein QYM36_007544 [Artemia franciscana]